MNIFFYPAYPSSKADTYCSELQSCLASQDITQLPGGSRLSSSDSINLRSGDILVLFAENDGCIEELLSMQKELKEFRIIFLYSPGCNPHQRTRAYKLSPRYISDTENMTEISSVVMHILLRNDENIWSSFHKKDLVK